jgi:hypothetical protein
MAGPLLNNVLQSSNMNAPISSLVDEEEDETQSLFMQLTSSLSLAEMLAVMQGNLGAIQGLNQKLRNILLSKMDGVDTPDKRRELAEGEAEKFKSMLFIPGEVVPNVHEGFDPLLVSGEVVDTHFATILDVILDFDARNEGRTGLLYRGVDRRAARWLYEWDARCGRFLSRELQGYHQGRSGT